MSGGVSGVRGALVLVLVLVLVLIEGGRVVAFVSVAVAVAAGRYTFVDPCVVIARRVLASSLIFKKISSPAKRPPPYVRRKRRGTFVGLGTFELPFSFFVVFFSSLSKGEAESLTTVAVAVADTSG